MHFHLKSELSDALQSISTTCTLDDLEECKQTATLIVNNLLTLAIEKVRAVEMTELSESWQLDNHPDAQLLQSSELVEKPTTLSVRTNKSSKAVYSCLLCNINLSFNT